MQVRLRDGLVHKLLYAVLKRMSMPLAHARRSY